MISGDITRRIPKGKYAFDEVRLTLAADDFDELSKQVLGARAALDTVLPFDEADPGDAPAHPAWTPPPAVPPAPQGDESLVSPCGADKGTPLGQCSDASLTYLATQYKANPAIREAAARVLQTRAANQATRAR
ncbi:MAG: hypothetical protein RQ731_07985 [Anaerosomatales bacterium]|nr:hypothetical protein [Anaerosomatales bacterium]